jgi:hypothetical protein
MDQKTWLWRKKSSEKAIVTTDKINSSSKGNEEEVIQLLFCSLIISLLLILLQNWMVDILHNGSLFKFIALWVPQFRVLIKPIGSLHWHVNMLKSSALAIKCLASFFPRIIMRMSSLDYLLVKCTVDFARSLTMESLNSLRRPWIKCFFT